MKKVCSKCGRSPAPYARLCDVCQSDVGFPNVRAAQSPTERAQLRIRIRAAYEIARSRTAQREFSALGNIAGKSRATFNRRLASLHTWLMSESPLFINFFGQIAAGRIAQDNTWDRQRASAENAISPHFYRDLSIAALTTSLSDLSYYGPYKITLREELIAHRSTVFEKNPFFFCKEHTIVAGEDAPFGYRAEWRHRGALAKAKLGHKVAPGMSASNLADLLTERRGNAPDCDFIEVHIFGPIHRAAIERLEGPRPIDSADILIWSQVCRIIQEAGGQVKEIP
jgi:hypothetical protein